MRINLIIFLMTLAFMHVSASVDAQQKISLALKDVDIKQAFEAIEKQSGYGFWFQKEQLTGARKVTLRLQDVSLKEALDECFKGQPFTYEIVDKTIVVRVKAAPVTPAKVDESSRATIRGQVTDMKSVPLVGVSVRIKGTNTGTITDANGRYSIEGNADGTVVFSYIGYQTLEIKVNGQSVIDITMVGNDTQLDQVQVIAYGTTTRRMSTGNISSVKAADIANTPTGNPILALQGRASGIYIQQTSGNAGGDVTIRIQGQNSINNGNDPFYVIDGVPYTSSMLPPIGLSNGSRGGSVFNFINPADIESIDVLKDADATAIYGSKAANGAILITTKKGQIGATKVDVTMQTGWGKVVKKMDLLDSEEYVVLRKEGKKNDNSAIAATDYDINGTWDQTRYTDWQKELIGGTARYNDVQARVSGGNATTQFSLGAGYHKETTVFPGDFNDSKGSVNVNINHASNNKKFRIDFSGFYLQDINKLSYLDITSSALKTPPDAPAMYNADGSINWAPLANGTNTFTSNPARTLAVKYSNNVDNLLSNLQLSYQLLPSLSIKSSFGYNRLQSDELLQTPLTSIPTSFNPRIREASYSDKRIASWIIEPQVLYALNTSKGNINFLAGATFQKINSDLSALTGSGYNSDLSLPNIASASNVAVTNSIISLYKYSAAFGRISYDLDHRYLLNLTVRRDGSSRFGSENLFQNFYSVGGAWIISEESFLKDRVEIIDFAKLKASYGSTGNDQIGDYRFISLYTPVSATVAYQGIPAITPSGHISPFIQWEQTNKLNLGIDLAVLGYTIELSANYFQNRSSNQLLNSPLALVTGFNSVLMNIPATIQNSGLELSVNTKVLKKGTLKWNSNLNITLPCNKLIQFDNLASYPSYANLLIVGKPITIKKLYKYSGVNKDAGYYEFFDAKGGVTNNPNSITDRLTYVNTAPAFFGGWQNTFSFKGIQLDLLVQGVKQIAANYDVGLSYPGANNTNQPISVLHRWKAGGDIRNIQRASSSSLFLQYANVVTSDRGYTDASFIRFKNASFSYALPQNLINKAKIGQARVFILGQNLLTFSPYKGLDPETASVSSLPPLRVITTGIQLTM